MPPFDSRTALLEEATKLLIDPASARGIAPRNASSITPRDLIAATQMLVEMANAGGASLGAPSRVGNWVGATDAIPTDDATADAQTTAYYSNGIDDAFKNDEADASRNYAPGVLEEIDDCPGSSSDAARRQFLNRMSLYLGPPPNVENHFRAIKPAEGVRGKPLVHRSVAERLRTVAAARGKAMPAFTDAFSLRRRHCGSVLTVGFMAHPLGLAIDYFASHNPKITDPRLIALQSLFAAAFRMEMGPRVARRALIRKMGSGEATDEQIATFDQAFELEFRAMSAGSDQLRALAVDKEALRRSRSAYASLVGYNYRKRPSAVELARLQQDVRAALRPLFQRIEDELNAVLDENPMALLGPSCKVALKTEATLGRQLKRATDARLRADQVVSRSSRAALKKAQARAGKAAELQEAVQKKLVTNRQELRASCLAGLTQALLHDLVFVLGVEQKPAHGKRAAPRLAATNPPVLQLLELGFFNPEVPGHAIEERGRGFNLAFMLEMAHNGFDQGSEWGIGSVDPMHFELVEKMDELNSPEGAESLR